MEGVENLEIPERVIPAASGWWLKVSTTWYEPIIGWVIEPWWDDKQKRTVYSPIPVTPSGRSQGTVVGPDGKRYNQRES